ncbi:CoA-binding protein, partial [Roseomonas mucosa]|uniref:CoA-binding protein n=1 Tax=Roseomonas mucosa TaxID=207340 RepID=UPI00384C6C3D
MRAHRLEPLINPHSIAILGASENPARVGGMPLRLLLQHGFAGPVYPINPKYQEISGLRCYVRRQNIRHNSRRRLAECGPRQGVDVRRRTCG